MNPNSVSNGQYYTSNPDEKPPAYDVNGAKKPGSGNSKNSRFKEHLGTALILIAAPLLALVITFYVFRTYQVDGPSMETTLQDGDRLIINKIPRTVARITGNDYIPERYDIIVFSHSGQFSGEGTAKRQLIKRVIGIPGDRVVVKNGVVTVFNSENPNGFLVDRFGPEASVIESTNGNIDQTVNEGEVFVMGDNRENSLDSRGLGTVHARDVIGKLTFRIYPLDKWENY